MKELVDDWDANFTDTNQDVMFKTLLVGGQFNVIYSSQIACVAMRGQAANYMDIKPLLMLMCAKVASLMKGSRARSRRSPHYGGL